MGMRVALSPLLPIVISPGACARGKDVGIEKRPETIVSIIESIDVSSCCWFWSMREHNRLDAASLSFPQLNHRWLNDDQNVSWWLFVLMINQFHCRRSLSVLWVDSSICPARCRCMFLHQFTLFPLVSDSTCDDLRLQMFPSTTFSSEFLSSTCISLARNNGGAYRHCFSTQIILISPDPFVDNVDIWRRMPSDSVAEDHRW